MNKTKVHELMRLADLYATASGEKVANREYLLAALEAALAEPEQEPVAWVDARWYEDGTRAGNTLVWAGRRAEDGFPVGTNLYTHPATPLSDAQIHNADPAPHIMSDAHRIEFARAIEQAHGIGVKK